MSESNRLVNKCTKKCKNQITVEAIIRDKENRFEYINEIIAKARREIINKKISNSLDDEMNVVTTVLEREFCAAICGCSEEASSVED
ncbi:MAG: hypothetical protein KAH32_00735 [Chlamydiia bacterium]|nr:hypothetical protein [Chlamydiia bacterium]